jgi:hypothetical protein
MFEFWKWKKADKEREENIEPVNYSIREIEDTTRKAQE